MWNTSIVTDNEPSIALVRGCGERARSDTCRATEHTLWLEHWGEGHLRGPLLTDSRGVDAAWDSHMRDSSQASTSWRLGGRPAVSAGLHGTCRNGTCALLAVPGPGCGILGLSVSLLLFVPVRTHINIAIVMDSSATPEIDKDLEKGPDSKSKISLSFFS